MKQLIALLLLCSAGFAQGVRYDNIALRDNGAPAGGATIRICTDAATGTPCSPLASIYSNQALSSSKTNPFTADAFGNFSFYAAPGEYKIEISGAGISTLTLPDVSFPATWLGTSFTAARCVRINTAGTGLEAAGADCGTGGGGGSRTSFVVTAGGCNNATAASSFDLPATTPAAPACNSGTNVARGVLDFLDTSGGFAAQTSTLLPQNFDAAAAMEARVIWYTSVTNTGLNVKWSVYTACTAVNSSNADDPTFSNLSTVTGAASATANAKQMAYIASVTKTGCAAGNILHLKIFRDGADASDTLAATARLYMLEITYGLQ